MRGRQSSNIYFNEYDHMDALTRMNHIDLTPRSSIVKKYYNNDSPMLANQIVVCDENGEVETVWRKEFTDDWLGDSSLLMVINFPNFYFEDRPNYYLYTAAIVSPYHKNINTSEIFPFYRGRVATSSYARYGRLRHSTEYGYMLYLPGNTYSSEVWVKDSEDGEYYCPIYISVNGIEWILWKGLKQIDSKGTKYNYNNFILAENGFYIGITYYISTDPYVTGSDVYWAYVPFDKDTMTVGEIHYYGEALLKYTQVKQIHWDHYYNRVTEEIDQMFPIATIGDTLIGCIEERHYPKDWKPEYNDSGTWYARLRLIIMTNEGEITNYYTKMYHSGYNHVYGFEFGAFLKKKNNKITFYCLIWYDSTYTLTFDIETGKIEYPFEDHDFSYGPSGSGTGMFAKVFDNRIHFDSKTEYYYTYFWENDVLKSYRTKDFISFEVVNLPAKRTIQSKDGNIKLTLSLDQSNGYYGDIEYFGNKHEFTSSEYVWPNDFLVCEQYHFSEYERITMNFMIKNEKLCEVNGIYLYAPYNRYTTYNDFIIYIKNFDYTASNEDFLVGTLDYDSDPFEMDNPPWTLHSQTLLDQLYNIGP